MRSNAAFSLIETIIAIAICGIVLGALGSVTTSSLRQGRDGNLKIQATQFLDTIGRRIANSDEPALMPASGSSISIDYGELDDFVSLGNDEKTDPYRVTVTNGGQVSVGMSWTVRYRIEVCYRSGTDERCVAGTTLGAQGSAS